MTLPTIEPAPDENASLSPARRRRRRRMILPADSGARADLLHELSHRTVPSFDFFLFSLLAGVCLGAALLLDSPALVFLAVLLAPFMAPAIGISLGTITGAVRFILQSLGSLTIGSLIMFLCGMIAGWAARLLPQHVYQQALLHSHFTWADFIVLSLGAGLTAYLIVRSPQQKPLVTSVALAYELYLPAGTAGFGLSSGIAGLFQSGTGLFFTHLVWAALIGTLVLGLVGLRPLNAAGYFLGISYTLLGLAAIAAFALAPTPLPADSQSLNPHTAGVEIQHTSPAPVSAITHTPTPPTTATIRQVQGTTTPTLLPTPTHTLIPSFTPTITNTPISTPVWARIYAVGSNGAIIRAEPNYNAAVVSSLLNSSLVEILPEVVNNSGADWVHIRTVNNKEGWIVRTLLRTATPAPGW